MNHSFMTCDYLGYLMNEKPQAKILVVLANTIRKIPKGKVATYGQVAAAAGFPGAARQVVRALRSFRGLPWHRVVGAGGKIRTSGEYAWLQRERLMAEGIRFRGLNFSYEVYRWRTAG